MPAYGVNSRGTCSERETVLRGMALVEREPARIYGSIGDIVIPVLLV